MPQLIQLRTLLSLHATLQCFTISFPCLQKFPNNTQGQWWTRLHTLYQSRSHIDKLYFFFVFSLYVHKRKFPHPFKHSLPDIPSMPKLFQWESCNWVDCIPIHSGEGCNSTQWDPRQGCGWGLGYQKGFGCGVGIRSHGEEVASIPSIPDEY